MKKIMMTTVVTGALFSASQALACGDVQIAVFSWQSAEAMAFVDKFILEHGYDCNATTVAGDTVPTITSMIERGQPDIAVDGTPSLLGEFAVAGLAEGRIEKIGVSISDGSVSGWYIPKFIADAHPDIVTVEDAMKRPELFPAPENPSRGGVIQGPQGWGDTVVTAQLYKALDADSLGFDLVPSGTAAALDGAITRAYEREQGFIAAYWSPTSLLALYPMVRLEMDHDPEEWGRCTTVQDCPDPKPNYWKPAEMLTLASNRFVQRDDVEEVKAYYGARSWTQDEVARLMKWMTENQAGGEDAARWFIENMPEVWNDWVSADVADKVRAAL